VTYLLHYYVKLVELALNYLLLSRLGCQEPRAKELSLAAMSCWHIALSPKTQLLFPVEYCSLFCMWSGCSVRDTFMSGHRETSLNLTCTL